MKHLVIYVPGLGDKRLYAGALRTALALWRTSRVRTYYFVVKWADKSEHYDVKLQRLLDTIDDQVAKGYTVSLVAASAGSSLALTAYAHRKAKIHTVTSVCGKLHNPGAISEALFAINPAFRASLRAYERIESTLNQHDRKKVLIVRAWRDVYVPAEDGEVVGAHTHIQPTMGHVFSVIMALTFCRWPILRFIKRGV